MRTIEGLLRRDRRPVSIAGPPLAGGPAVDASAYLCHKFGIVQVAAIASFRAQYAPRASALCIDPGQGTSLARSGLRILGTAPVHDVRTGSPPRQRGDESPSRYLWVIDDRGIPYILEAPLAVLQHNLPKHTNLTAGGRAYLGGELWFSDYESMYVSGGSGRYPPLNAQQLADAVDVFISYCYKVTSLGWDTENDRANRFMP